MLRYPHIISFVIAVIPGSTLLAILSIIIHEITHFSYEKSHSQNATPAPTASSAMTVLIKPALFARKGPGPTLPAAP